MKTWILTVSHVPPHVLQNSLVALKNTTLPTEEYEHVILDHHWPKEYWATRHSILDVAMKFKCRVISNYRNIGGHEGFQWMLDECPIEHEDIVICYDPDSNPITPGWISAMKEVLTFNPPFNVIVALNYPQMQIAAKNWQMTFQGGICVKKPECLEMTNVTGFRASFLKQYGFRSDRCEYYGHVESYFKKVCDTHKLNQWWLQSFDEMSVPLHDRLYQDWKIEHSNGRYLKNFDEFVREKT